MGDICSVVVTGSNGTEPCEVARWTRIAPFNGTNTTEAKNVNNIAVGPNDMIRPEVEILLSDVLGRLAKELRTT